MTQKAYKLKIAHFFKDFHYSVKTEPKEEALEVDLKDDHDNFLERDNPLRDDDQDYCPLEDELVEIFDCDQCSARYYFYFLELKVKRLY